jgi:integrase
VPRARNILYEVRKSNYAKRGCAWFITGYAKGRRQRVWFKTEKLAKKSAAELNEEIAATGTLDELPHELRIMALVSQRELAPFEKTIADATSFYLDHLKRQTAQSITVTELIKRFITEAERQVESKEISARHFETIRWATDKLQARLGEQKITVVKGAQIKAWITNLPLATKSKNRLLTYNRNVFSVAKEWGLLAENPLAEIPNFRLDRNSKGEIQILTVDELTKLLKKADQRLVPYLAIGAFAGLRDAELTRLDWSEIDLKKGLIEVTAEKAKTAQRRFVDVSENLAKWLRSYMQSAGPVAPVSSAAGHIGEPSRKLVYELRKSARIAAGMRTWKPNCLRHSFCSYHYAMHEDAGKAASQAGHVSPAITFKVCRERVTRQAAAQYWAISPSTKS